MDQVIPQAVSPHIQRVLKSFQSAAVRSLNGPSNNYTTLLNDMAKLNQAELENYRKAIASSVKKLPGVSPSEKKEYDPIRGPPPFPVQQMPVFTPIDSTRCEKSDTLLEGETISCFSVGGEKRLCLPQILNSVLRDFTLQQINAVCDELHIFCSRCNPNQLETLKASGILPASAPSCGLITKTDAERLCNALLHRFPEKSNEPLSPCTFKVYHECFGKCKGLFNPDFYTHPSAKCIQCVDCQGLFSPQKFVCHSHKALENRTCHWGFDSANWRCYLLLAKDQTSKDKLQELLEDIKSRYDTASKCKRKHVYTTISEHSLSECKRAKSEDRESWEGRMGSMSAFQPWSPGLLSDMKDVKSLPPPPAIMRDSLPSILPPFLQTGPPVLLNPERVVPHSESERYERHFAPNVSLAPQIQQKVKAIDKKESHKENAAQHHADLLKSSLFNRDIREYDLPTESSDESVGQDSPEGEEDDEHSSPPPKSSLEEELAMVRKALSGEVPDNKEARESFLHEFSKLRAKHEEVLNNTVQAKRSLKKDLKSVQSQSQQKQRESLDKSRRYQRTIELLQIEKECRMQESSEEKERLLNEIKCLQTRENVDKYVKINQDLQAQLQRFASAMNDLQRENLILRDELSRRGVNLTDILPTEARLSRHSSYGALTSPTMSALSSPGSIKSPLTFNGNCMSPKSRHSSPVELHSSSSKET